MSYPVRPSFGDFVDREEEELSIGLPLVERADAMALRTGLSTEEALNVLVEGIQTSTEALRILLEATHES